MNRKRLIKLDKTPASPLETYPINEENLARHFAGKLLLRNEIPLSENFFQQILSKNYFQAIPAFINKKLGHQCRRCGNDKKTLLGMIPCDICHQTHLYCRKCINVGRVMACEPLFIWTGASPDWPIYDDPCTWKGELTIHQSQASQRIVQAIETNEKEILTWAVCGAGKTEMIFAGITKALQQGKRLCLATPRADVVRELKPRLQSAFADVAVKALYGGSPNKDSSAQLILATTHQLLRFSEAFDVMIIDEVDAFPYHADPSLGFATSRARTSSCTTIYLTATPRQEQQSRMTRKQLPYVFVPLRYHGYPLPVPQMKMTFRLKKELQAYRTPSTFISWLKKRKQPNRQLLIFVPTISLAENLLTDLTTFLLTEKIIKYQADIAFVHAEDEDREEKVQQFRDKILTCIVTTTILERGVTFPSVDVVIFDAGHDVFDEAALVQISGRAGRSADDPTGEVIFFHDGKTEAMVRAIQSIKQMNKRGGSN